ncbi:hypothetical protein C4588_00690 [Candidatus Parcubacteria bacterium]|nr:MAG: hypothetical protein C4588_00690 [Candidatus Parcubacteria bacterium]
MTIGIGIVDPEHKKIFLAADTIITYGEDLKKEAGSKFIEVGDECLIIGAGTVRLSQIFNLLVRDHSDLLKFKNELDVVALAEAFYERVNVAGVGEANNNDTPIHEFEFLIANKLSPYLYIIEGDYSVSQFKDYAAIGAGFLHAQAALHTLNSVGIKGKAALEVAMKTTLHLHPYCGGQVEIRELPLLDN